MLRLFDTETPCPSVRSVTGMTNSDPTSPDTTTPAESVVVVTIDHRHGTTSSAHRTSAGAEAALLDHAATWWHELAPDPGPIPSEPHTAIEEYFRRHPGDFYSTETVELLD